MQTDPINICEEIFCNFFLPKSSKKIWKKKSLQFFFEASNIKEDGEGVGQCQVFLQAHFHTLNETFK
jgi:hypothetical protein